jgi:hypothetical protein
VKPRDNWVGRGIPLELGPAGDGLGVTLDVVVDPDPKAACCIGGEEGDGLIRSAASLTLVGTLFKRIAPSEDAEPGLDFDISVVMLDEGLKSASEGVVHGEGRVLSGEIIEAEVESEATGPKPYALRLPPGYTMGRRDSNEEGCKNSEGRRCRGGLRRESAEHMRLNLPCDRGWSCPILPPRTRRSHGILGLPFVTTNWRSQTGSFPVCLPAQS